MFVFNVLHHKCCSCLVHTPQVTELPFMWVSLANVSMKLWLSLFHSLPFLSIIFHLRQMSTTNKFTLGKCNHRKYHDNTTFYPWHKVISFGNVSILFGTGAGRNTCWTDVARSVLSLKLSVNLWDYYEIKIE